MRGFVTPETVLASITLVNWGAWEGLHTFELNVSRDHGQIGMTVLSGLSGSGKSTVLDGFTHLMLRRGSARFNEAADQVRGRSREDKRSVSTYMKGKLLDEVDGSSGKVARRYMRPNDENPVWSSVSCKFLDLTTDSVVSAAVFDWLPAGRDSDADVTSVYAILDGSAIDPLDVQRRGACSRRFDRRTIQSVWPGAIVFDHSSTFLEALYPRIGVTKEAMRVLNRIQASSIFSSVDELFKSLVLGQSETYALAADAVSEFDSEDENHQTYLTDAKMLKALDGIDERVATYDRELQEHAALDALTARVGNASTLGLWEAKVATSSYTDDLVRLAGERRDADERVTAAKGRFDAAERRLMDIRMSIQSHGGARLNELKNEIDRLGSERQSRLAWREKYGPTFREAGVDPSTKESWAKTLAAAERWLSSSGEEGKALEEAYVAAAAEKSKASDRAKEAEERLEAARARHSAITREMAKAREGMAEAMGLKTSDIPFVAELVDVTEGMEQWRTALDDALGNISRIILVPKKYESRWRRTVDPLANRLGGRYSFEFVDTEEREWDPAPNEGRVSSVAQVDQSSPFADYVAWRIANNKPFDYRLVLSPEGLSEEGCITASGQVSTHGGGAVGHRGPRPIIGFRSDLIVSDAEAELANARSILSGCERALRNAKGSRDAHEARRAAIETVRLLPYETVDVASCSTELAERKAEYESILHDPRLRELEDQRDKAEQRRDEARRALSDAEGLLRTLRARTDAEGRELDRWEVVLAECSRAAITVSDAQRKVLDDKMAVVVGTMGNEYLAGFADAGCVMPNMTNVFEQVRGSITSERKALGDSIKARSLELVKTFEGYMEMGVDPDCPVPAIDNRGAFVTRYREIADRQVGRSRNSATVRAIGLVAQKLAVLNTKARDEMLSLNENIAAINRQIGEWDFGDYHGRIGLCVLDHRTPAIRDFQSEMAVLASMATRIGESGEGCDTDALDEDFERLRGVCETLRGIIDHDKGFPPELMDPYLSTEIVARVERPDREKAQQISSNASMSGGEKQEVFAFLSTAAVLFALDMAGAQHPSYTPYIMDEAFIASDGDVTTRALRLLRGVGFQLIFVAPEGKEASYERERPLVISIKNDRSTHKSSQEVWRPGIG